MSTRVVAVTALTSLALLAAAPAVATPSDSDGASASYIVQFTPGSDRSAEVSKAKALGMTVRAEYQYAISGMSVEANAGQVRALQANPNVKLVEPDAVVTISTDQTGATWGLDRTNQRDLPLDGRYSYSTTASNVTAYIIDTGVLTTHGDLGGRVLASAGYSAYADTTGTSDCNGHGTHVAGTVAGSTWGIAKGAKIVPVRVLGCDGSGTSTGLLNGIEHVIEHHAAGTPAVANMSLGFAGIVSSVDTAVANMVADGVTVAVAAGNNNGRDACNYTPARVGTALTVGSTTSSDARSSFSNIGTCLDIFAPGSSITSAWYTSNTATNTISGTSMATPHVAGAAALYLADHPTAGPAAVASALTGTATTGKVTSPGTGSPNLLLYTGATVVTPPPPPSDVAPSAPTSLTTINVARTTATLAWSAPTTTGTTPITYTVSWGKAGPKGTVTWLGSATGLSSTRYDLTGLSTRTKHVWEVKATNGAGTGPSASASFTTKR